MYGIYANIGGILMGSMLPYIAAPWILWYSTMFLAAKHPKRFVPALAVSVFHGAVQIS